MSTLHVISTLVLLLIVAGIYFRKQTRVHLAFMACAFAVDLAIVFYVEITRHAVNRVVVHHNGALLWVHVAVSVGALVLYGVQFWLGRRMLAGRRASRGTHARVGMSFCALRGANYLTSFFIT